MQIFCGIPEFSWMDVISLTLFLLLLICSSLDKQYFTRTKWRFEEKSGLRKCLKMFEPKISLRGAFHAVFFHA